MLMIIEQLMFSTQIGEMSQFKLFTTASWIKIRIIDTNQGNFQEFFAVFCFFFGILRENEGLIQAVSDRDM